MISPVPSATDRRELILRELTDTRTALESTDSVEIGGTRTLTRPQGSWLEGQSDETRLRAVSKQGDAIVVLTSESLQRDTTAVQVAAGAVGGVLGGVLGGRRGGLLLGLATGLLSAWGAGKLAEASEGTRIERTQIDAEGVTTERLALGADGEPTSYTMTFHRTVAPVPLDPDKVKEYIDNLELK